MITMTSPAPRRTRTSAAPLRVAVARSDVSLAAAARLLRRHRIEGVVGADTVRTEHVAIAYRGDEAVAAGEIRYGLHGHIGINRFGVVPGQDLAAAQEAMTTHAARVRPPWV